MHSLFNHYQVLRNIVSELDSNIDRLCFSLTCRQLFASRELYLRFKPSPPFKVDADELLNFIHTLKLYKSMLSQSTANVDCWIRVEDVPSYCTTLDFAYDKRTRDMSKIPSHIHTLFLKGTDNFMHGILPTSITRLKLDMHSLPLLAPSVAAGAALTVLNIRYHGHLPPHYIPSSVTTLKLRCPEVRMGDISHSVTLSSDHISVASGVTPTSVTHLSFTRHLVGPLSEGVIPASVTWLYLREFTVTKDIHLPTSITTLTIGKVNCIRPVPIPSSVTDLTFANEFNSVIRLIPASVRTLRFGALFDQSLEGMLPSSLTHLGINNPSYPCHLTSQTIPSSVTSLDLGFRRTPLVHGFIPGSVTSLTLNTQHLVLTHGLIPPSVTRLTFFGSSISTPLVTGWIPPSVTSLAFDCSVRYNRDAIPASTTMLRFGHNYFVSQPLSESVIPPTITSLDIAFDSSDVPMELSPRVIPESVAELTISYPTFDALGDADLHVLSQLQCLKVVNSFCLEAFETIVWIFKSTPLTSITFTIDKECLIFRQLVVRKLDKNHTIFLSDFQFSGLLSLH
ncbi:hypothetical protein SAMD00019534_027590 [Acytostelium subglobosum LB1]|uniref:hypothetical protein n=1 Tax=Acytostelium subglobosum LB1 TaxID=1410327 RepID=UPI0006448A3A|nr:hypothetical protein SAMD00019534_027590 [Acytostelium subglobosum LB1]GAM19584.1 hypothetical protein SAMD00019534_027590 [Acytostelium subglobosum LB1]|eukprot:XP_012757511.1 hypothetical protein SAMD00019534_027590 [Acytostelium subglobosum LB1]